MASDVALSLADVTDIGHGSRPINRYLVGGLEHDFDDVPYIGIFIIPTDYIIFFRGVGQPPTRYKSHC